MAEIQPFIGIRYTRKNLDAVAAPPYDVISPAYQDALYEKDGHNVVRIDFGRTDDDDSGTDNRYTRSAAYLDRWLKEGVLAREDAPALYLYEVGYKTPSGEPRTMTGFICMVRLEEWDKGVVLPHEGTLKGPKADRFELMKATGASASQVFAMYKDRHGTITGALKDAARGRPADAEAADDDGWTHRLWAVKDAAAIKAAQGAMLDKKIFIADGHHRYETALAYRDHCRAQGAWTGDEPFNFVPMFLANMEEEGLTILPTHRLIRDAAGLAVEDVLTRSMRYFHVEEISFTEADEAGKRKEFLARLVEKGLSQHAFGLYYDKGSSYYLLTLKELDPVTEALRCGYSAVYCNLDVTILHELVIERVLGIDTEAISAAQPVQFEKDGERAIERVAAGEFAMCFLLNATKVREVREVALNREIMPQKSTYFYPKLLTGLVIAEIR